MISILLPTRNRPKNVKKLLENIINTVDKINNIEICFYIDNDDNSNFQVLSEMSSKLNIQAFQGERIKGSQSYNELYKNSSGDIIMFCADDVAFRTNKWDKLVEYTFQEYPDKIMFVYGQDGIQNEKIGTHGFIHKNWVETVGYVLPPYLASAYTDSWITDLSEMVKRRKYLPELIIEHLHPMVNKSPNDNTYIERFEMPGHLQSLYDSLLPKRIEDANKLNEFIKNYLDNTPTNLSPSL